MAKKDMGQTMEQMYPSCSDAKEKQYPETSFPLDLFKEQPRVGDKVYVEFEAVVESISKTSVRLKLTKGEEVESKAEEGTEDEPKTLMG